MKARMRYNWNNVGLTGREVRIAKNISQMLLFGSKVQEIKSSLKQINSDDFLPNRKNLLPNSKFCNRKNQNKSQTFKFLTSIENTDDANGI